MEVFCLIVWCSVVLFAVPWSFILLSVNVLDRTFCKRKSMTLYNSDICGSNRCVYTICNNPPPCNILLPPCSHIPPPHPLQIPSAYRNVYRFLRAPCTAPFIRHAHICRCLRTPCTAILLPAMLMCCCLASAQYWPALPVTRMRFIAC
jgi:hypothetical protein